MINIGEITLRYMYKVRSVIFILIVCFTAPSIHASSVGPNDPANASGTNWKYQFYVYSSDNNRAFYNNSTQDILAASSYGFFGISGSIDGIKVEIEGFGISSSPPVGDQIDVALTKNGSGLAGSWKIGVTLPNGVINEDYITAGGATDLWGTTWTPSEIQNANFGVLIRDTDILISQLDIDHVRVTVYFTSSSGQRRLKIMKILSGE